MKAIMLVHGFLTDKNDFSPIIPELRKRYNYVRLFNLPGHNKNEDWKYFTADSTMISVVEEFDNLKRIYDSIDVMGFSMGGALAVYLSTVRKVNSLILLSPANKFINFNLPIQKVSFYFKCVIEKNKNRRMNKKEIETLNRYNQVRLDDMKSTQMAFRYLIPNYNYHTLSNFVKIINRCNKNINEINVPTLIIWGKLDQLVPKSSVEYIYSLCKNENKKLVIIDDKSHLMLKSNDPYPIIKEVINFIDMEENDEGK